MKTNIEETIVQVCGNFTARYSTLVKGEPKNLILLLHGYSQTGEKILDKLGEAMPFNSCIVAPNGPFPIPIPEGNSYKVGFSWYFYEADRDEYYLDMSVATEYLLKFIDALPVKLPVKKIIGYSQGGYLAPFVAQKIKSIDQLVGISCEFLEAELKRELHFPLDAIHGEDDTVVDAKNSQNSHRKLIERGVTGNFHMVKGADHKIGNEIKDVLKNLL